MTTIQRIISAIRGICDDLAAPLVSVDRKGVEDSHKTTIAVRDGYRVHTIRTTDERAHTIGSIESMIAYCTRHSDPDQCTVFVSQDKIEASLQDEPDEADGGDHVTMELVSSLPRRRLGGVVGKFVSHKDFVNAIDLLRDYVDDSSRGFLAEMRTLKGAREVSYDAKLGNAHEVHLKVTDGVAGAAALPDTVAFRMPLWRGVPIEAVLRFRLRARLSGGDKPTVELCLDDMDTDDALDSALGEVVGIIAEGLPDSLVIQGTRNIVDRR